MRVVKAVLNTLLLAFMLFWFVVCMVFCFLPHYANASWAEPWYTVAVLFDGLPLVVCILIFPFALAAGWAN